MQIASRISSWSGGGAPTPPTPAYWGLYFEAEEANAVVGMTYSSNWQGNPKVTLEYSTDGITWATFNKSGGSVTLANVGDRVFFRAGATGNTALAYYSGSLYGCKFTISGGRVGAHGNIMSLLNATNEANVTITGSNCFRRLFYNCTLLTSAPELPATTLAGSCYYSMFEGCTSLASIPTIFATSMGVSSCFLMFSGCSSLTTVPILQTATLAQQCYYSMFKNCTGLTTVQGLPATTLAPNCYDSMFSGCSSLTTVPAIPATTLATQCCNNMFAGCTALVNGPELPAATPENYCYNYMFSGCSALANLKVNFTDWGSSNGTDTWMTGVASTGTFYCPTALGTDATIRRGNNYCPSAWTVVNT